MANKKVFMAENEFKIQFENPCHRCLGFRWIVSLLETIICPVCNGTGKNQDYDLGI